MKRRSSSRMDGWMGEGENKMKKKEGWMDGWIDGRGKEDEMKWW